VCFRENKKSVSLREEIMVKRGGKIGKQARGGVFLGKEVRAAEGGSLQEKKTWGRKGHKNRLKRRHRRKSFLDGPLG